VRAYVGEMCRVRDRLDKPSAKDGSWNSKNNIQISFLAGEGGSPWAKSRIGLGFEFAWAWGPPIDMKIGLSLCGMLMGVDGTGLITLWIK
ncbi:MAG TPA: hypothetical protein VKB49_15090, partial [Candidatus Sulfotelmatobacter sp.]|nr:hypothetical protein [Candidatus Sulfotelmatobacter sp.]